MKKSLIFFLILFSLLFQATSHLALCQAESTTSTTPQTTAQAAGTINQICPPVDPNPATCTRCNCSYKAGSWLGPCCSRCGDGSGCCENDSDCNSDSRCILQGHYCYRIIYDPPNPLKQDLDL